MPSKQDKINLLLYKKIIKAVKEEVELIENKDVFSENKISCKELVETLQYTIDRISYDIPLLL